MNKNQLLDILSKAKNQVRFIGIVALDADWEDLAEKWASKIRKKPDFQIYILCESDNMLFSKSFTSDTDLAFKRRSFQEFKFIRDRVFDLNDLLLKAGAPIDAILNQNNEKKSQIQVEIMHLQIPVSIVQVDNRIFTNLWLHELDLEFEEITKDHPQSDFINSYIEAYFNKNLGRKYSCEQGEEILELFDHDRIPRGIFPRESFYDTDYSQVVVWALIFDRKGRLLIHRRDSNAKDNLLMWDKSVGGHVDFKKEFDTSRSVVREVVEELFSEEMKKSKVDLTAWAVSDEDMIYLGDWRPNQRRRHPFLEINKFHREWAFFRLPGSQPFYSPRTLKDGRIRSLRTISDVYLFVSGPGLTDDSLGELKNSKFKLIEISELKNAMNKAIRNEEISNFDQDFKIPLFTPDLTNIMTGKLRDSLEEFTQYIKKYIKSEI